MELRSMASYFVTICTKNRAHYFGEIVKCEMHLNDIGNIAEQEWIKTLALRPDMNLELGEFVVMPNHFHGIIIIGENKYNTPTGGSRDAMHCVSTTPTPATTPPNQFGPQSKNLASIIGGFKSAVTTHAKKTGNVVFGRQSRFHDHIIRDAKSFDRIQDYIINNPSCWKDDKFYT